MSSSFTRLYNYVPLYFGMTSPYSEIQKALIVVYYFIFPYTKIMLITADDCHVEGNGAWPTRTPTGLVQDMPLVSRV